MLKDTSEEAAPCLCATQRNTDDSRTIRENPRNGGAGALMRASAPGARCARITAPAAMLGVISLTILRAARPAVGARMVSPAGVIATKYWCSRLRCGTVAIPY